MSAYLKLRPQQETLVGMLRREIASGNTRVVAYGATGFGKSVVIDCMTRAAVAKGKRVAIIANRIHLIRQLSERFSLAGIWHGVVQGDNSFNTDAQVVICSIQTVARRGLPHVDVILIDEGHACAGSKDFRKVIFSNSALPIVAFSATPFSKGMAKCYSELGGEPLFQALCVSATIRELIDANLLVDCDIFAPTKPDLTGVGTKRNTFGEIDYKDSDLEKAVDTPKLVGDIVAHWLRLSAGKPTVCFATSIAHSQHIVSEFMRNGISAKHIDCYMSEKDKEEILDGFKAGEFTVLSNVALIAEGFDYPECGVMILARPTKSLIRYIQMAGRVLRTFHGKDRALIIDHSGSSHTLGYPTDDLPLELDDGKPKDSAPRDKKEKAPKECPSCHYMKPAKVHACPKCGFAPARKPDAIDVEDGELALIHRGKGAIGKVEKQSLYSQLIAIQRERGYSDGWVANQYRKALSVWPRGLSAVPQEPTKQVRDWVMGQMIRWAKAREKEMKRAA